MVTDGMRLLIDGPRGLRIANAYLQAIERQDLSALKRLMAAGVTLTHGNYPSVRGRDEAVDMIRGYLAIVEGVEFDVDLIIGAGNVYVIEKVNVAAAPNGSTARIRTATFLEVGDDELLTSVRIYADTTDLFRKLQKPRPPNPS